ncbi:MAG: SRPBCC domain-containing protein [Chitinophagales bacterium]|nr:SRPBCC domain-containing protein [Chitinophagales bacterium]
MKKQQTSIVKDAANRKIVVVREFDAPLPQVWEAWTDKDILDLWWAPKSWKAETKSMDFWEGGVWLYSMVSLDGAESYCRADFKAIVPYKSYIGDEGFCDKNGTLRTIFRLCTGEVNSAQRIPEQR